MAGYLSLVKSPNFWTRFINVKKITRYFWTRLENWLFVNLFPKIRQSNTLPFGHVELIPINREQLILTVYLYTIVRECHNMICFLASFTGAFLPCHRTTAQSSQGRELRPGPTRQFTGTFKDNCTMRRSNGSG